ncbi:MAG: aldo/keto reductase [Clostridiales bacterium]|nr:aldo/keto reductase [Clostridiales bacterium]
MKYTYLGRTGLRVSRLCLGTMNFGPLTDEKDAFRIMDEALDNGINFFDTADVYGSFLCDNIRFGWTEEIIGRWFKQGGGRREKVVLATKLYLPMEDANLGPNDENGLSAYKIRINLENSLRRLQTDHIELYQMHRAERRTPWVELWGAFENAIAQGKIGYVGASNFQAYDLAKAQWAADKRNFLGMVSEQHRYNLIYRKAESQLLPACEEMGIGIICWSPLQGGLLSTGALQKADARSRLGQAEPISDTLRRQLTDYAALCKELGHTENEVGLAWLMHQPQVTCPITGPRTIEQLRDALKSVDVTLDKSALDALDAIFPPVGAIPPGVIIDE